jgi:hypothetical protein
VFLFLAVGASEFGGLLLIPGLIYVYLGSPLFLLGLVSLAIARGLGRPPLPTIRRRGVLEWLIQDVDDPVVVVGVVLGAGVLVSVVFASAFAIHSAPNAKGSAFVSVFFTAVQCAIPLLTVGLLVAMARGFPDTRPAAITLALVQDLLTVVIAAASVIPTFFPSVSRSSLPLPAMLSLLPPWLWAAVALAFGGEAVYLLRLKWQ